MDFLSYVHNLQTLGPKKKHHFLLKCLYQSRRVNSHVCICVLGVSILLLSTIFLLELGYVHIVQCGIFFIFFSFYCSNKIGISPISNIIIKYSMFLLLLRAFQLAAISQHFIICCNFNVSVEKKISENYP